MNFFYYKLLSMMETPKHVTQSYGGHVRNSCDETMTHDKMNIMICEQ